MMKLKSSSDLLVAELAFQVGSAGSGDLAIRFARYSHSSFAVNDSFSILMRIVFDGGSDRARLRDFGLPVPFQQQIVVEESSSSNRC